MGCVLRKESKCESVISVNNDRSVDNPLRIQHHSLFTVKEEVSDMEQSRVPSKRVSAVILPDKEKVI